MEVFRVLSGLCTEASTPTQEQRFLISIELKDEDDMLHVSATDLKGFWQGHFTYGELTKMCKRVKNTDMLKYVERWANGFKVDSVTVHMDEDDLSSLSLMVRSVERGDQVVQKFQLIKSRQKQGYAEMQTLVFGLLEAGKRTAELETELHRQEGQLEALRAEKMALDSQIAQMPRGGGGGGGGGGASMVAASLVMDQAQHHQTIASKNKASPKKRRRKGESIVNPGVKSRRKKKAIQYGQV